MGVRGWLGSTREGAGSGCRLGGPPLRPQCMEPIPIRKCYGPLFFISANPEVLRGFFRSTDYALKSNTTAIGGDPGRADWPPEKHSCGGDRTFSDCLDWSYLFRERFLAAGPPRISARAHIKPDRALYAETRGCAFAECACTGLDYARCIFCRCLSLDGPSDRVD